MNISCEATGGDPFTVTYDEVVHVTRKAAGVRIDGDIVWLPFSQILDHLEDDNELVITEWIADKKGLM